MEKYVILAQRDMGDRRSTLQRRALSTEVLFLYSIRELHSCSAVMPRATSPYYLWPHPLFRKLHITIMRAGRWAIVADGDIRVFLGFTAPTCFDAMCLLARLTANS